VNSLIARGPSGHWITARFADEAVRAFVPAPLPPDPPLRLEPLLRLLSRADVALGRFDGLSRLLPDASLFLYAYVRKEALLSSQIEGTQSSLADILAPEGAPDALGDDDVREVSNYVAAIEAGMKRLAELPLSLRLIRELHAILLNSGRGARSRPGEFRTSQNWIGGSRPGNALFVPPPPDQVMPCLDRLERFLHDEADGLPPLIRAGLAHAQFETIHPFLDGNGRLGRLIITLMLCSSGVLSRPLLYLSLFFKQHRDDYYRLLQEVREHGAWEAWLEFFLRGVAETATEATEAATRILDLFKADADAIQAGAKRPGSAFRVFEALKARMVVTQASVSRATGLGAPTVNAALEQLLALGIAREVTGRKRDRVYRYERYFSVLREGTEPL
jgi:Fic family protein